MSKDTAAFWLSLLIAGSGQIYKGHTRKGCLFLLFTAVFGILFFPIGIGIQIWSAVDAKKLPSVT